MNILETIAEATRDRVQAEKQLRPFVKREALSLRKGEYEFEKALKKEDIAFICECKKASPSKGIIAEDFPYLKIAREYEVAGASAISVLTEPMWFLGKDSYLEEISSMVKIPCLRKDFTVDEYMIYRAKLLGAKAVLLIKSILDEAEMKDYFEIADGLGLSALVETHDEKEIESALKIGARVIGVNNRNLKTFSVNFDNSKALRSLVPKDKIFVAESGVKTQTDVRTLREIGVDAVLIGETLMRAADKKAALQELSS